MAKYDLTNAKPFNEQPLYKQGFEDAIDKACEWMEHNLGYYNRNAVYIGTSYEQRVTYDFRKAMGDRYDTI